MEEKVDGANLGFSVDGEGMLRAQNRGSYLDLADLQGQWRPLRRWLSTRRHDLEAALGPHLVLFGEWCHAVHSVRYARLPDWFLVEEGAGHERSGSAEVGASSRNLVVGRSS